MPQIPQIPLRPYYWKQYVFNQLVRQLKKWPKGTEEKRNVCADWLQDNADYLAIETVLRTDIVPADYKIYITQGNVKNALLSLAAWLRLPIHKINDWNLNCTGNNLFYPPFDMEMKYYGMSPLQGLITNNQFAVNFVIFPVEWRLSYGVRITVPQLRDWFKEFYPKRKLNLPLHWKYL